MTAVGISESRRADLIVQPPGPGAGPAGPRPWGATGVATGTIHSPARAQSHLGPHLQEYKQGRVFPTDPSDGLRVGRVIRQSLTHWHFGESECRSA